MTTTRMIFQGDFIGALSERRDGLFVYRLVCFWRQPLGHRAQPGHASPAQSYFNGRYSNGPLWKWNICPRTSGCLITLRIILPCPGVPRQICCRRLPVCRRPRICHRRFSRSSPAEMIFWTRRGFGHERCPVLGVVVSNAVTNFSNAVGVLLRRWCARDTGRKPVQYRANSRSSASSLRMLIVNFMWIRK